MPSSSHIKKMPVRELYGAAVLATEMLYSHE